MIKNYFNNDYLSEDDLKKDYFELCKTHHPDKGGNTLDFIQLNKQYQEKLLLIDGDPYIQKLAKYYERDKIMYGKTFKVVILPDVIGKGTTDKPFIGNIEKQYYKNFIIFYNANKTNQTTPKLN